MLKAIVVYFSGCGDNNKMYIINLILLGHADEPIQTYCSLATETKQYNILEYQHHNKALTDL